MSNQNYPVVEPGEAAQQTANWRKYYTSNAYAVARHLDNGGKFPDFESTEFKALEKDAFRGFRIPIEDLEEIMETVKRHNKQSGHAEQINSIRVYLAREKADPIIDSNVHVYLVPVKGGIKIPGQQASTQQFGTDMLRSTDKMNGSDGESTIFNFSTPCPTQCDETSPLYSLSNSAL